VDGFGRRDVGVCEPRSYQYVAGPTGRKHALELRKMVAVIVVGKELIRRAGKEAGLKPYLLERYVPANAAVFCIDEESAIQMVDRGAPNATGANTIGTGRFPWSRY